MYSRGVYAVRELSLRIDKGEFVFLTGPSGAGKSTLLRLLLRQEIPSEGRLVVGQRDLSKLSVRQVQAYRRSLGFVFQDFKLLPNKTVLDNVAFVPRVLSMAPTQQQRRTFQVLKWVGLQHRMNAYPMELSGGEQQRIAIARALVNDPVIILADEPTGNLDPDLSLEIMNPSGKSTPAGRRWSSPPTTRELIRRVGRRPVARSRQRHSPEHPGVRALQYFSTRRSSLWRNRRAAAVLSMPDVIAAGLFRPGFFLMISATCSASWALERRGGARRLPRATRPSRMVATINELLTKSGLAASVQFLSKDQARHEFARDFPDSPRLVGLARNPFPASFAVRLNTRAGGGRRRRQHGRHAHGVVASPTCADRTWLARLNGPSA